MFTYNCRNIHLLFVRQTFLIFEPRIHPGGTPATLLPGNENFGCVSSCIYTETRPVTPQTCIAILPRVSVRAATLKKVVWFVYFAVELTQHTLGWGSHWRLRDTTSGDRRSEPHLAEVLRLPETRALVASGQALQRQLWKELCRQDSWCSATKGVIFKQEFHSKSNRSKLQRK